MSEAWSLLRRVAFRFGFLYLLLNELPRIVKRPLLPGARKLAESVASFEPVVRWFGHHVLGVSGPLVKEYPAGGDSLFEWVRFAFLLLVAAAGAAIWSVLDRRRAAYPLLLDLLRTYVRYSLAFTMMFYGVVKVLPIQFQPLRLGGLTETYGDSSPMGLLWKFMGSSRPYCVVAGAVELTGALLLFSRRTTFLGAVLLAGAGANVLALNLAYDVPVKLLSAHLLAMAVFLAAPEGTRVLRWVVARVPPEAKPWRTPLPWPQLERVRPWVKVVVIGWCSVATVYFSIDLTKTTALPPTPALFGQWLVESVEPPAAVGWHRLLLNEWSYAEIETLDGEDTWWQAREDATRMTWALSSEGHRQVFTWVRPDADHVILDGEVNGAHARIRLRHLSNDFLLTSRGFHWVQEEGFNR